MSANTTNSLDAIINKSLDEIDEIVKGIKGGNDLKKGLDNDDEANPDEVSNDAPEDDGAGDEPADEPTGDDTPDDGGADDAQDTDTDNEGEEDNAGEEDEDTEKSLESELNANESVRKALEVSEFLQELVKGISSVINDQRADINKSMQASESVVGAFAKSFEGIAKSQKAVLETQSELMKSVRALNKRIASLESQPVVRKSVANAQVVNKSFEASLGGKPSANQLSKSEVLSRLNAEFSKGNMAVGTDILAYESTGDINAISSTTRGLLSI